MWSRVETFIRQHGLLSADGLYVVALSGGADSVALLLMLHEAGYRVHAAHCNFHLRGDESNRDEAFCQHLCQRIGVPLHLAHFDTRSYADVHHVSIEMAHSTGVQLYRLNSKLCNSLGINVRINISFHYTNSVLILESFNSSL